MPYIKVNYKFLKDLADAGDNYCDKQRREMEDASSTVRIMHSGLKSDDIEEFYQKWECIQGEGSAAKAVSDSIKEFSDGLRSCAEKYRKAQEDSYNEACWL